MHLRDLQDPYILVYFAPLIFAVLYILVSFLGEKGK